MAKINLTIKLSLSLVFLYPINSLIGQKIEIINKFNDGINLGSIIEIGIIEISRNGDTSLTKGFLNGKKPWRLYDVNADGGTFEKGYYIKECADNYLSSIIISNKGGVAGKGGRGGKGGFRSISELHGIEGNSGTSGSDGFEGNDGNVRIFKWD
jgi:hypothetical protein